MRRSLRRVGVAVSVVGITFMPIVGSAQVAASVQTFRPHALIPLYDGGNATDWAQTCSHVNGSGGRSWIIADVAEGAGAGGAPVASWAKVIEHCYRYNKASVIGYVWTDYGQNSLASVEAGIDNWVPVLSG
jgi:hypothetical protein